MDSAAIQATTRIYFEGLSVGFGALIGMVFAALVAAQLYTFSRLRELSRKLDNYVKWVAQQRERRD